MERKSVHKALELLTTKMKKKKKPIVLGMQVMDTNGFPHT